MIYGLILLAFAGCIVWMFAKAIFGSISNRGRRVAVSDDDDASNPMGSKLWSDDVPNPSTPHYMIQGNFDAYGRSTRWD